jgi:hypothetical protein
MTILIAVLKDLVGMFIADIRLTVGTLALVSLAALLHGSGEQEAAALTLVLGLPALLVLAVMVGRGK